VAEVEGADYIMEIKIKKQTNKEGKAVRAAKRTYNEKMREKNI